MKHLFSMLLLLFIFSGETLAGAALPVSKMQNAVSGVTQSKMQNRGFAANDPRYNGTLAGVGASIAAASAHVATVTALGVTAPAWVTVAAGAAVAAAVGAAVYFAIDEGLKWLVKDGNNVQVGDNPQSPNTPAGLPPPTTIYAMDNVYGASWASVCNGQPVIFGEWAGVKGKMWHVFENGHCMMYRSAGNNTIPLGPDDRYTVYRNNTQNCPGIGLKPSNGACPASNFPEPDPAPIKSISDAAAALTEPQKARPLDPQIIADLANEFWRAAASAPGYNGLPYDAAQPITSGEAAAWQAANPQYWPNVGDFVAPQPSPSGGTASTPFTMPFSPKPSPSTDPTNSPSPGTNPSKEPLQNLGPDPGIGAPSLEGIPTAQQIIAPLMNPMPSLKSFVVPSIDAQCPTWAIPAFGKQIMLKDHCPLLEDTRNTLYAVMAVVYALGALFIVLRA